MKALTHGHIERFRQCIPKGLALDIPRFIREATSQAYKSGDTLLPDTARDVFPHNRRALVETAIASAAKRYSDEGVWCIEAKNKTLNASHVEIYAHELMLIAAAVEGISQIPREAEFRNSLLADPQLRFSDPNISGLPSPPGNVLVGVILYGPSSFYPRRQTEARPGFVVVRFPVNGWARWAEGEVNLLRELEEYESRTVRKPARPRVIDDLDIV